MTQRVEEMPMKTRKMTRVRSWAGIGCFSSCFFILAADVKRDATSGRATVLPLYSIQRAAPNSWLSTLEPDLL